MPTLPPGDLLIFDLLEILTHLKKFLVLNFMYVSLRLLSYFSVTIYCTSIDFKISFTFSLGNLSLCICAKKGLHLFLCTCFMGLCSFFNNCFTRINRMLVNSFSYDNRIFQSRQKVIIKLKNNQTGATKFSLCSSCLYSEF